MSLVQFLQNLRKAESCQAWAQHLISQGHPISRQALEHYLAGRRIPRPDIFRLLLTTAGRSAQDPEGWRLWCAAQGIPWPEVREAA